MIAAAAAAAAIGTASGYTGLLLTTLWTRTQCLPVAAHETKWECDAAFIAVVLAYFASSLLPTVIANRHKIASGLAASGALFLAHAFTPYLSITFFGEGWYQSPFALLLAGAPAVAGLLVGILIGRRVQAHAL
jgi:hypothetical protein